MARQSDSFFIRADLLLDDTGTFAQTTIDLGAYVDALGKAVLRVHNIESAFTASDGTAAEMDANSAGDAAFKLQLNPKPAWY